jgi:GxxExxY protein
MIENRDKLTETIIGCAFSVSNALGCGFLEKVYENALVIELRANGVLCEQQKSLPVIYR